MDKNQLKKEQGVSVIDLLLYLLTKWKWYVLSLMLCVGIIGYKYATTPFVYYRSAKVIIKDPSNKVSSVGLDKFDNYINKINVANEILQFQSKHLMRQAVMRIHADVDYLVQARLRYREQYSETPIKVSFLNVLPERYIGFSLTLKNDREVLISNVSGIPGLKENSVIQLNDTLTLGEEQIVLTPTFHLNKSWIGRELIVRKNPMTGVVARNLANLGIRQEEDGSSILRLSIKGSSPQRIGDLLNMLITVYNEEAINDKNRVAINTAEFISERLSIIEQELGGVESRIETFKQDNQIVDLGSAASQYVGESQAYNANVQELGTQFKLATFIKDYLTDPSKDCDLIPSNTGISDINIENQINQYNTMKLKRDHLIADSSEENPIVKELNTAIHALRQSIIRAVDNMIVSISVKQRDAESRQKQAQQQINAIPTKEREMGSIERQHKIKETLYMFLLNRREENALSQAMVDNNARVIDGADGSDAPIYPLRTKFMLMALLLGFATPTVVFLMIMFLDTRVHGRKDLLAVVSAPFLGEIPYKKHTNKSKKHYRGVSVSDNNNDALSEAFRIIRTNILFMCKKKNLKVITFTSFNPGAGKTFVALNLANSFTFIKKRVLLLDLDIRKGSLSHYFPKHRLGVTNYLADPDVKIDDLIHPDPHNENLDVISAGMIASNPAELLMDERLDELMAELRNRYDYIIVDNVPVGIIADAKISNRISDMTMFIVRAERIDRRLLPDLEQLYQDNELNKINIILNGVDIKKHGYVYGYGYGYGYGYSYGKSNKK